MLRNILMCMAFLTAIAALPAKAAISIYTDSSNFGSWANATGASNALGAADGVSAVIPNSGWIAFQVTPSFTAADFVLNVANISGAGTALFYVGNSNGAGWFSGLSNRTVSLATGVNNLSSAAQNSYCAGQGGCDIFLVQAWGGTSITLDSALDAITASAPEPSAWALMIIGFIGLAGRMKLMRRNTGAGLYAGNPTLA